MPADKPAKRLGRGLDALFNTTPASIETESALKDIPLSRIRKNPFQPRKEFNPEGLKELRDSLQATGLLQPITVRKAPESGDDYELIAGERRLRAATDLGWKTISAVVKDLDDRDLLSLALIENLQRADLNPVEEAEGYSRLITEFGHTQQTIASMVGRDRSTIANMLRVLQLPSPVLQMLRESQISLGHARPLLALSDEKKILELAKETAAKGLSARDVEQRVREGTGNTTKTRDRESTRIDAASSGIRDIQERLQRVLQTDVKVTANASNKGTIKVSFYSADDLERLVEFIESTRIPH